MTTAVESMFTRQGDHYLPTDRARGPWHPDLLHGGATAGLLAHAVESLRLGDDFLTTRMTFDLMLPVPVAPLAWQAQVVREGRRVRYADAQLSADGRVVARASAVMMRRGEASTGTVTLPGGESAAPLPGWQALPPAAWMNRPNGLDARRLFHAGIEVRLLREPYVGQPMAVWARVPYELCPGRALTPIERAATMADFTNGIGLMSQAGPLQPFINSDITLYLHREPVGEWLCLDCAGRGDRDGLCSSSVNLFDETGLFGHAMIAGMRNVMNPQDVRP